MSAVIEADPSVTRKRNPGHRRVGPYSRKLRSTVISADLDGRSALGRYIRDLEAQLTAHVGGSPTVTQRLLIMRCVKIAVQLDTFDDKLVSGNWTEHDQRTHGALMNALRLCCRELGMKSAPTPPPSLDAIAARIEARKAAAP